MPRPATSSGDRAISFGPFRLFVSRQLLLENDRPVRLGSRAFGILVALIERAGEMVPKADLFAAVWPDTTVEETNLRVHMAALRRTPGDGHAGNRFIATIPGRGYSFVARLSHAEGGSSAASAPPNAGQRNHNLPMLLTRMVGRAEIVETLTTIFREFGEGHGTADLKTAESLLAQLQ
jgi:DNA-binding winged helix-turn-helix (wHTH) protein